MKWSDEHTLGHPDDDFDIPEPGSLTPQQAMAWLTYRSNVVVGGDNLSDLIRCAARACGVDEWGEDWEEG